MADNFKPTKNFENYISFDDNSRRFMLARGNRVFSYDVLKGYELVQYDYLFGKKNRVNELYCVDDDLSE